jgi:hypothetical protein
MFNCLYCKPLNEASVKYFNMFNECANFFSNDCKTNVVALLKIASLATVIVPVFFWCFSKKTPNKPEVDKTDSIGTEKLNVKVDLVDDDPSIKTKYKHVGLPSDLALKGYISFKAIALIEKAKQNYPNKETIKIRISLTTLPAELKGRFPIPNFRCFDALDPSKGQPYSEFFVDILQAANPYTYSLERIEGNGDWAIIVLTNEF